MLLLNFAHPITSEQLETIRILIGANEIEVRNVPTQLDPKVAFLPQLETLVEACALTTEEWQTLPILVNPPGLSAITALLLAELHGRMGYFPTMVRVRPVANAIPPRFEVAELLNLQAVRDEARKKRQ